VESNRHNPQKHRKFPSQQRFGLVLLGVAVLAMECFAQQGNRALSEMTLEDLMNVEVTSVAKRQQPLSETAAAVYVITQEDIRRSGATSIPEALRLAPGVQVAQINAHTWAVTIRGFDDRYANKLLVLIDGRVVYTPLFSGTVWNLEDVMLEDVERIEVIRGPGASLWGSNAVNGVINIITKPARETQGGLLAATGSNRSGHGSARYGDKAGENFVYRVFGKYSQLSPRGGLPALRSDAWYTGRGGFRADWRASPTDSVTFSGDLFRGAENESYTAPLLVPPYTHSYNQSLTTDGGDLLSRWRHRFVNGSESAVQFYYDRLDFGIPGARFRQGVYDLDFQYQTQWGSRQQWMWGAGYRATTESIDNSLMIWFDSKDHPWWRADQFTRQLFNGFVQDEIAIVPSRLSLTLGSKFESNQYTGIEYQPSARLHWQLHPHQSLWVSVSRAVRTPNDYEEIGRVGALAAPGPGGLTYVTALSGNPGLRSEQMLAYEAGYRIQPVRRLFFDAASFYNTYHHLIGVAFGEPFLERAGVQPHVIVPLQFENNHDGKSYGVEFSSNYVPFSFWKLTGSYSWLHMTLDPANVITRLLPGSSPRHSFQIHSNLSLRHSLEFDNALYWVDRLAGQPVPAYLRFDTRLAWHPAERIEFSVSGQNLLRPLHPEFDFPTDIQGKDQVSRTVYGKIAWQF
jgi:iron complex outermembrane recepter protein